MKPNFIACSESTVRAPDAESRAGLKGDKQSDQLQDENHTSGTAFKADDYTEEWWLPTPLLY